MKENGLLSISIHDSRYVLKYCGEKGIDLGSDVVASLVNSQRNADSLSPGDEAAFWTSYTKAASAIKPATIESMKKAYATGASIRIFSKSIHCGALCTPKRTMWFYCLCIFLCLLAIVFFQYFSYFGVNAINRIDTIKTELIKIPVSIEDTELRNGSQKGNEKGKQSSTQRDELANELTAQSTLLMKWNEKMGCIMPFAKDITGSNDCMYIDNSENNYELKMRKQRIANLNALYTLNAINSYLMPLLFGVLGSFVFIVRDLSERIKTESYVTRNSYGYLMRWPLGAVSGATIGYILKVDSIAAFSTSLTPFGVAFVMGYSVDVFFRIFDAVIDKLVPKSQQAQAPGK